MKKVFVMCSLMLTMVLVSISIMSVFAGAESVSVYGELSYTVDDGGITIVDCSDTAAGTVSVPAKIDGVAVTGIADNAFADCFQITDIIIPASVSTIGDYAFYRCYGLTSVKLSFGLSTIGAHAFDSCKSLVSVFVPTSVTAIGDYAFSMCSELSVVTVASSVKEIGENSFKYCNNMSGVYVTDSSYAQGYLGNRLVPMELIDGDADGDGILANSDISAFVRHLSGWDMADTFDSLKMDVYTDGKLSNRDVIFCIQKLAGWN